MRKKVNKKLIVALLSFVLLFGGTFGSSLAWLLAESSNVQNTFTPSNINITLSEEKPEGKTAKMVPGWTIDKDPKVKVIDGSEACWLFVEITESDDPKLDDYIIYGIADGWITIDDGDNNEYTTVIGRKVYTDDSTKEFGIIGYTDTKGTADTADDVFVADKVLVKDTVDKQDMADLASAKPTLAFEAYAVQLFKTNDNLDKTDTSDEFSIEDAWELAKGLNPDNGSNETDTDTPEENP